MIVNTGQEANISIWDLTGETLTRFTFGGGLNSPVWTPDGRRLVWGARALFWQAADGTGTAERLAETDTSGLIPVHGVAGRDAAGAARGRAGHRSRLDGPGAHGRPGHYAADSDNV